MDNSPHHKIILFDGLCNLCSGSVQFVLRHDKKKQFRFASLQSDPGARLLRQHGLPTDTFNSFVLVEGERIYTRSTGALRMLRSLGGGWALLYGLIIVPRFIRDGIYDWIARHRYQWFGKKEVCWLPTPDLQSRFLR